jgi:hypothetical protein
MRTIDITIQGQHQLPLESNKMTKNLESTRRQKESLKRRPKVGSSRQHPHATQKANDRTKTEFVEGGQESLHSRTDHGLFIWVIQVLIENLGHGEHMDPILLKHCAHRVIAADLASIARILQFFFTDVLPYLLNSLWTRKLVQVLV